MIVTDREAILLAMETAGVPLTTAQISHAVLLDVHRVARTVGQLIDEHCISHHARQGNSWSWRLEDIGRSERRRMTASRTGKPLEALDDARGFG